MDLVKADQVRLQDKALLLNVNAANTVKVLPRVSKVLLKEDLAEARDLSRNMARNHLPMEHNPDREIMVGAGTLTNKKDNQTKGSVPLMEILWAVKGKANRIMVLHNMEDKVRMDSKGLNRVSLDNQVMANSMEAMDVKATIMANSNAVMEITAELNIVNKKVISIKVVNMATREINLVVTNLIGSKNNNDRVVTNMDKSNTVKVSKVNNMDLIPMRMKEIRAINLVTDKVHMVHKGMDNPGDMNLLMGNLLMDSNGINGQDKAVNQVHTVEDKKMLFVEDRMNIADTRDMVDVMSTGAMSMIKVVDNHPGVIPHQDFAE